jgi:hypothetical protein
MLSILGRRIHTMVKSKVCLICHITFTKSSKLAYSAWEKTKFCSIRCHGVSRIGFKQPKEWNKNIAIAKKGINNPAWKGDEVTYKALHQWIRENKQMVSSCEKCSTTTSKRLVAANVSGKYLRDVDDYLWLCDSCHRKMDYTPEVGRNISKGLTGIKRTKETKRRMSEAAYRRWNSYYKGEG